MHVMVTGGTGFVGSHTVAALLQDGHNVRLLVRNADRIAPALEPLNAAGDIEHVVGDATDVSAVERAVAGCDAVVHAAAVFSLDSRDWAETRRTNVRAADAVLRAAVANACDPIIHVSSTVALLRRAATVTPDSPLSTSRGTYIRSKVASEQVARALQDEGAPVVIVSPGGVYGPHDPHLSGSMRQLRDVLRGLYPLWTTGGFFGVDVRDVARVTAAAMTPGAGPRRYLVPGHHLEGPAFFGALREVTGRRLPYLSMPTPILLPMTWGVSAVQRILPMHIPADYEGIVLASHNTRYDCSRAEADLGVSPTPLTQTMTDAVHWLHQAGHISARHAGAAAGSSARTAP
jgi:nucleoside-diphosphate-sugar epimerase